MFFFFFPPPFYKEVGEEKRVRLCLTREKCPVSTRALMQTRRVSAPAPPSSA